MCDKLTYVNFNDSFCVSLVLGFLRVGKIPDLVLLAFEAVNAIAEIIKPGLLQDLQARFRCKHKDTRIIDKVSVPDLCQLCRG